MAFKYAITSRRKERTPVEGGEFVFNFFLREFLQNIVFLVARNVFDGNELMTAETACEMIEVSSFIYFLASFALSCKSNAPCLQFAASFCLFYGEKISEN